MIEVTQIGKMSVALTNGKHSIVSDVAKESGGDDEGLNPHELIEAALGACTVLTLEMYAKRKKWDLTNLKVEIKIIKEGEETVIDRKMTFGEQNSPEERKRLIQIADKCPIHNLLEHPTKIQTHD